MCGIIGVIGRADAVDLVRQGLVQMRSRGRDACGMATPQQVKHAGTPEELELSPSTVALGHALHAIVDHVPQPLKGKGVLVVNGEEYNWRDIDADARNDAQVMLDLLDARGVAGLDAVEGVYALAYLRDGRLVLARDILGEKPLWYSSTTDAFAFCSEKKVLVSLGFAHVQELNPRHFLTVDVKSRVVSRIVRAFFSQEPIISDSEPAVVKRVEELFLEAVRKRVPDQKFGLLFSGGIDSTLLAFALKKLGHGFTCYSVSVDGVVSKDAQWARRAEKSLGLDVRHIVLTRADVESFLPTVVPLIEDSNVVKVGVGLTFFAACRQARADGCKVIFSGLGSEEIFAGYARHLRAADVNRECVHGLLKMYERDLYRDDVVTMANSLELRLPFLDHALVRYALRISPSLKIANGLGKMVLRRAAIGMGIAEEFALRPKSAAQYGSGVDKVIGSLARRERVSKSEYLRRFYPSGNVRLAVLFSGGKDSAYAAFIMREQNYELACLVTVRSRNPHSYMFHTPAIGVTRLQAEAMGVPHIMRESAGEKEDELADLRAALAQAKETYHVEGVVSGALFSTYQRDRIERICDELGLKIFAPLWHKPQEQEMEELLRAGFSFMLTSVAAQGLDASWLGRVLDATDLGRLKELQKSIGINVAGEGGEFESLVLDCPLFKKRLSIETEIMHESSLNAHVKIRHAKLIDK